jgi:hypothetical protein
LLINGGKPKTHGGNSVRVQILPTRISEGQTGLVSRLRYEKKGPDRLRNATTSPRIIIFGYICKILECRIGLLKSGLVCTFGKQKMLFCDIRGSHCLFVHRNVYSCV